LDRDGTIIEDYEDELWRNKTEPIFLVGSKEQYQDFTDKFLKRIKDNGIEILDVFYCPHSRDSNCSCMKPKNGLVKKILEKYPEIDLKDCFIVGDSLCEVELGES